MSLNPLVILLIGMIVVIGGVLVFRLHAFLALLLGAFVVGYATSEDNIKQYTMGVATSKAQSEMKKAAAKDEVWSDERYQEEVDKQFQKEYNATFMKSGKQKLPSERIASGFGEMCTSVGILIAMAAIIGKCLIESGAADRIVRSSLNLVGEAKAGLAFMGSSFILGIPVFFDTVFYLMLPIAKMTQIRLGKNYLLFILAIGAGGSVAHSLVPPTPGPITVAELMGVNIGHMIIMGCAIGLVASITAYIYGVFMNKRFTVPVRGDGDTTLAELEAIAQKDESKLPPLWISLLPVLLPVILIAMKTVFDLDYFKDYRLGSGASVYYVVRSLGDKNTALIISAVIAMLTLVIYTQTSKQQLAAAVQSALSSGATIILITAAGGAFGRVLKQTGIGPELGDISAEYSLPLIPLAFFLTTAIRTAQGSSTVAMITAGGIVATMVQSNPPDYHIVYLAVAIGCGSKPIAWMNDSGFWVVCKISGMTESETLKYWTPMSCIMGLAGLCATMIASAVIPNPF